MNEPTDLDIRIGALQAEYHRQIARISGELAAAMAELASAQAKLKAAEVPEKPVAE